MKNAILHHRAFFLSTHTNTQRHSVLVLEDKPHTHSSHKLVHTSSHTRTSLRGIRHRLAALFHSPSVSFFSCGIQDFFAWGCSGLYRLWERYTLTWAEKTRKMLFLFVVGVTWAAWCVTFYFTLGKVKVDNKTDTCTSKKLAGYKLTYFCLPVCV